MRTPPPPLRRLPLNKKSKRSGCGEDDDSAASEYLPSQSSIIAGNDSECDTTPNNIKIYTNKDELVILKALIRFNKDHPIKSSITNEYVGFVNKKLSNCFTDSQLRSKVRSLKKRYLRRRTTTTTTSKGDKEGSHQLKVNSLCAKIWPNLNMVMEKIQPKQHIYSHDHTDIDKSKTDSMIKEIQLFLEQVALHKKIIEFKLQAMK